ncbi:hypothetical protein [Actinomadura keratinilytica]|uniref:hypothetical protein n=1 Tax=Actinomadura keratinilytica TaxID=547461 RepID=UPI0036239115
MTPETPRPHYAFRQFAALLGITAWQLRLAREHGLLPEPDVDGRRWSAELADRCADRRPQILSAFGEQPPIGAAKAAARLALRVGLDVDRADIEILVARGDLSVISRYQGNPVYLLRDLDALAPGTITAVVAARKGRSWTPSTPAAPPRSSTGPRTSSSASPPNAASAPTSWAATPSTTSAPCPPTRRSPSASATSGAARPS